MASVRSVFFKDVSLGDRLCCLYGNSNMAASSNRTMRPILEDNFSSDAKADENLR